MATNQEIAKAIFRLAQIIGTLAGVMFLTAGFIYINTADRIEITKAGVELCEHESYCNISHYNNTDACTLKTRDNIDEVYKRTNRISLSFMLCGLILAFTACLVWVIGAKKMDNKKFNYLMYLVVLGISSVVLGIVASISSEHILQLIKNHIFS